MLEAVLNNVNRITLEKLTKIDELPVHADWPAILGLGQRSQGGPLG